MLNQLIFCVIFFVTLACAQQKQQQQYTTPVPILKQINRHNEDGSYNYGYEGADGSFKIETKYPNGEVYGKYGYIDDSGKLREVEYGATNRGFEPAGSDINVPPPTVNNDNNNLSPLGPNEEDDGQYREDPSIYYKDDRYNTKPVKTSHFKPQQQQVQPQFQPNAIPADFGSTRSEYYQQTQPQQFQQQPQQQTANYQTNNFQPYVSPQQSQYYQQLSANQFRGHPATNFDVNTGSYSLTYTG